MTRNLSKLAHIKVTVQVEYLVKNGSSEKKKIIENKTM
jgi:hypothetical protein